MEERAVKPGASEEKLDLGRKHRIPPGNCYAKMAGTEGWCAAV